MVRSIFLFFAFAILVHFQLIITCDSWIISRSINNHATFHNLFNWNRQEKPTLRCSSTDSGTSQDGYWDPYSAPKLDFDECYYKVMSINYFS